MGKLSAFRVLQCFFIVFVLSFSVTARAQEVEDESEFSYDPNSDNGPAHWGDIRPEWYLCGNGTMQSPINIESAKAQVEPRLGPLQREYKPASATLVNRGHDIKLRWEEDAGYLLINKTRFHLEQCHWHSPSEHAINGRRFDLEIHCVHTSDAGVTAVVSIMYRAGLRPDPFIATLSGGLLNIVSGADESPAGIVDPRLIQITIGKYYRHMGSLTTPACTEGVIWTVVDRISTVSEAQVRLLRDAVHDGFANNARPLQPLNMRTVQLYKPPGVWEEM